jgi:pyruvate formate lyase activating enzyme
MDNKGSIMKYYKKINEKVVCLLCRHYCKLKDGQKGICGVNQNVSGEIKNLVYGHPIAINIDPVEKKPLNHFLPSTTTYSFGTVGCNFRCPFCQNWQISQERHIDTSFYISAEEMVQNALKYGCSSISYTYNEPTIFYPYAKDIALNAKKKGLKNIYVTNGFESPEVIADMKGVIDAANVDLKCFNKDYYKKTLKGDLEEILEGLKLFKKAGIWIEVTTLVIEGENDSDDELGSIAKFIANELGCDTPWHISAFHPDYKMIEHRATGIPALQKAYNIGKDAGLNYIYMGNVAVSSNTYCPKCNELLIKRDGYFISKNNIKNGHCPKCAHKIAGVWE